MNRTTQSLVRVTLTHLHERRRLRLINAETRLPLEDISKEPEVKKVRKPLLANTRSSRGRERKITWKMKEILRQAGYDPDADTQDDNPDDSS